MLLSGVLIRFQGRKGSLWGLSCTAAPVTLSSDIFPALAPLCPGGLLFRGALRGSSVMDFICSALVDGQVALAALPAALALWLPCVLHTLPPATPRALHGVPGAALPGPDLCFPGPLGGSWAETQRASVSAVPCWDVLTPREPLRDRPAP